MSLPLWQEAGRAFAFDVLVGLSDAGAFRPQRAIDEWINFHYGNGGNPFGDEGEWPESAWEVLREAARVGNFRREFEQGYRDGMREMRLDRKREEHAEQTAEQTTEQATT